MSFLQYLCWWAFSITLVDELSPLPWLMSFLHYLGWWAFSITLVDELSPVPWLMSFLRYLGWWAFSGTLVDELFLLPWLMSCLTFSSRSWSARYFGLTTPSRSRPYRPETWLKYDDSISILSNINNTYNCRPG